jgi:hypothetical protein
VGDFLAVYQRIAVFDLLGMVAATVRARGHLSLVELHVPNGMRRTDHNVGFWWIRQPCPCGEYPPEPQPSMFRVGLSVLVATHCCWAASRIEPAVRYAGFSQSAGLMGRLAARCSTIKASALWVAYGTIKKF